MWIKPTSAVKAFGFSILAIYLPPKKPPSWPRMRSHAICENRRIISELIAL